MPPPVLAPPRRSTLPARWDGVGAGRSAAQPDAGRVDPAVLAVQRDALTPGTVTAAAAPTLTNPRFVGDRVLQRILDGEVEALSTAHNGRNRAVGKVQQALVDLGFELPMHAVDGDLGTETEEAIRQFRSVHAPPASATLDATALAALDRVAPPPGTQVGRTVDYDRLLADDRLDITVALGHSDTTIVRRTGPGDRDYEDTGTPVEVVVAERFREWLGDHGFELSLLGLDGEEFWSARRTLSWTARDGRPQRRPVTIWVRLVTPGVGAAAAFGRGLSSDEIAIYKGHARYGSGPDFDPKAEPVENFRIGIDRALQAAGRRTRVEEARRHGVAVDEENDLVEMTRSGAFDRDRYRVWFFNACTSLAYLDELREHVGGPQQLDVVATRAPSMFSRVQDEARLGKVQRFLEGVLAAESVQEITAGMDEIERGLRAGSDMRMPRQGVYESSGFGDNPATP